MSMVTAIWLCRRICIVTRVDVELDEQGGAAAPGRVDGDDWDASRSGPLLEPPEEVAGVDGRAVR